MRNPADQLDQLLQPIFDRGRGRQGEGHRQGPARRPGRGVRQDLSSTPSAPRRAADKGEKVLLVRIETTPEDLRGMIAAEGILTARGGVSSHAALVAGRWARSASSAPAAVDIDYQARTVTVGGKTFKEGD